MNLPKLPFWKKKQNNEYFLSLVLRDEKASAVVFQEAQGKINVVGEHQESFKTSIEDATEEELLSVLDRVVSVAERTLPEGVESKKTIFGVKEEWTAEGKIKPELLAKLKKVSTELDFSPMGFLVIPEAVAHLMHKEEGAPLSAVLTEIGKREITIYIVKAGKILETRASPIEETAPKTVENLLKHVTTTEILPSRIILFDGGSESLQQEFMSHKWDKSLGFLHIPQITTLPANYDARAVLNGAAVQMGFTVLESSLTQAARDDRIEGKEVAKLSEEDEDKTLGEAVKEQEFGFSDTDVKKKTDIEKPLTAVEEEEKPKIPQSDNFEHPSLSDQFKEIPEEVKLASADRKQFPEKAAMMTGALSAYIKKLLNGAKGNPRKYLLLILPLALFILIGYFYFFGRSATVTFDLQGNSEQKEENVTFSQSGSTNASSNTIAAQFIEVNEEGKITTNTTGKKETGDKAKGTVTIFNNSSSGKTFSTGTSIKSEKGLEFLTDKPVTVASASGDTFSGTDPGKANIAVTAAKFGTEYNLPSDTKFSIEGAGSDVAAKNDNAFSGGTKKDIKVVAKADQDKLLKDLQKQKEGQAREDIAKKADDGSLVLPNFVSVTYDKKSFSKDIDDEADEVSLTGTITYEGISYNKSDLVAFAKEKLKKEIPSDMTIDEDNLEVSAANITTKNGKTTAKLDINAEIIPMIDQGELADKIKGKSIEDAEDLLSQTSEIKNVEIKTTLDFLPFFKRLPFSSGKIKIVINNNG